MTNFEQWRNGLTINKLLRYFKDGFFDNCAGCPAARFCNENIADMGGDCSEMFTLWGNAPAENISDTKHLPASCFECDFIQTTFLKVPDDIWYKPLDVCTKKKFVEAIVDSQAGRAPGCPLET